MSNTSTKKDEGPLRNVPFSLVKVKKLSAIAYQKIRLRMTHGECINNIMLEKKIIDAEIDENNNMTEIQIKDKTQKFISIQKVFASEGK